MKKGLLILSVMAFILFPSFDAPVNTEVVQNSPCGTSPPCVPDCPSDQFSPLQSLDLEIAPGCTLRVSWAWRIACNTWYDYYLSDIQFLTVWGCPFSPTDINAAVNSAMNALLMANPAGFPPNAGQCNVNWRAGKGACWEQAGDCIRPCLPNNNCCLKAYQVCIDTQGNKEITDLGFVYPPTPCPAGCVDVCN